VQSGRLDLAGQLPVSAGFATEDAGNHFLLSVTRRSECCRSGSQIQGGRLYQRQSAQGRCRGMESCRLPDGRVKSSSNPAIIDCSRCDETQSNIKETTFRTTPKTTGRVLLARSDDAAACGSCCRARN